MVILQHKQIISIVLTNNLPYITVANETSNAINIVDKVNLHKVFPKGPTAQEVSETALDVEDQDVATTNQQPIITSGKYEDDLRQKSSHRKAEEDVDLNDPNLIFGGDNEDFIDSDSNNDENFSPHEVSEK